MTRKFFYLAAVLCAAALVSCGDDEDDDLSPQPPVSETPTDDAVASVAHMVRPTSARNYYITYDEVGRPVSVERDGQTLYIKWESDSIFEKSYGDEWQTLGRFTTNAAGCITSLTDDYADEEQWHETVNFAYSADGRLQSVNVRATVTEDGETCQINATHTLTWSNGNLVKITERGTEDGEAYEESPYTLTYGTAEKRALQWTVAESEPSLCFTNFENLSALTGIFGLPSRCIPTSWANEYYSMPLEFTFDAMGRIQTENDSPFRYDDVQPSYAPKASTTVRSRRARRR